jgi:hypothetical protein
LEFGTDVSYRLARAREIFEISAAEDTDFIEDVLPKYGLTAQSLLQRVFAGENMNSIWGEHLVPQGPVAVDEPEPG